MSVTRVNPPSVHNPSDQITQVVTVDGRQLVHLSGQVAWDEQGQPVGLGDHGAQAAQIARNLDAALAAVGATRDDIVDETVYVVDYTPELLPAIFGPLRAGVAKAPASTLVGVSALFAPGFLLEVKVVAALPGPGSQDRAVPADADTEAGTSARAHERDEDQDLKTDGTHPPGLEGPVLRRATGTRAFGGPGVDGGAGGPGGQGAGWQYCGAVGKRANCQVTVSVQAATDTASCPLQWALFLPEEWDQDPAGGGRRGCRTR